MKKDCWWMKASEEHRRYKEQGEELTFNTREACLLSGQEGGAHMDTCSKGGRTLRECMEDG